MAIFEHYAQYYDLLYEDKDYQAEAAFISDLLRQYAPGSKTILELGCGTCKHAMTLIKQGYEVCGVEQSFTMFRLSQERFNTLQPQLRSTLKVLQGDLRTIRIDQKFDVVLALFHVMSYQTTNKDILAAIQTVKQHLKPGGIFIFDIWYGPAVLSEKPSPRVKQVNKHGLSIVRFAKPELKPNENLVNVNYKIISWNKRKGLIEEFSEDHEMRYFFYPELEWILDCQELKIVNCFEWLTYKTLDLSTWGACLIAQNLSNEERATENAN